jgi:hypothetical protein
MDNNHTMKNSRIRWKREHEELVQLQVSDRHQSAATMTDTPKENEKDSAIMTTHHVSESAPTIISAFAYSSTPPLTRWRSIDKSSSSRKWKNRLSLIRPASFLRISSTTTTD